MVGSWCSKCGNSCAHAIFSNSTCAFLNQNAIITSPSGKAFLHMSPNGMLALYENSTGMALWFGYRQDNYYTPSYLAIKGDGNICTINSTATSTWCTDTKLVTKPLCLVVEDVGSIALYDDACYYIWGSMTNITSQSKFSSSSAFSNLVVADSVPKVVDTLVAPILTTMTVSPATAEPGANKTSMTGATIGIVAGTLVVIGIIVFLIYKQRQRKKAQFNTYRDALASPRESGNIDTIDSSNQILPQYHNPYHPMANESGAVVKPRQPKYDKVVDDEKVLDMRPLRKYRLDPSDLVLLDSAPMASGGNGEVWLGKMGSTTVAIKRLKKHSSNLKLQKFIDEVILMTKIDCPHIVHFVGASWFTPEDLSCVVEYMDYGDLRTFLANTTAQQFTWQQKKLSIFAVVKGLLYLHTCSTPIIHRDLKSRNVLLDSRKGTKLTDFGESREMDDATMTNDVGTFAWMAPEVISGRKYDAAADIYSFGALLTEYATHRVPYSTMMDPTTNQPYNQFQLIRKITNGQLKPSIDAPNTPKWVIEMANQCLKFDPITRPSILAIAATIGKMPE